MEQNNYIKEAAQKLMGFGLDLSNKKVLNSARELFVATIDLLDFLSEVNEKEERLNELLDSFNVANEDEAE